MQEPLSTQAKPVYANFSVYKGKAALSLRVLSASVLMSVTVPRASNENRKHAEMGGLSSTAEDCLVTMANQESGGVLQFQGSCQWVFCMALCHGSCAAGAQAALDGDGRGRVQPGKVSRACFASALACTSAINSLPHAFAAWSRLLQ